jgi:DNA-directed RNA polymerase sigma subunit (sigma70/sigma32)
LEKQKSVLLSFVSDKSGREGRRDEDGMDETRRGKRITRFCRGARTRRILARLREGWAYDEVGREEGVSERRIRQIVAEHLKRRDAD